MTIHSISSKGWVVIPADLRKKYHLYPGDEVKIIDFGGVMVIVPVKPDAVKTGAGMLKSGKALTQILLDEHRNEQ
jgi:AbrB family looped-hinge helix DNA binding protein